MIGRSRETRILWKIPWSEHFKDKIRCRREKKTLFSQENEEEEDASGKTIKDIEEEKKAEKEKQQK